MKHERNRIAQTRRTDREKTNRLKMVKELPDRGEEGDFIYKGELPELTDDDGYYVRIEGEWRPIVQQIKTGFRTHSGFSRRYRTRKLFAACDIYLYTHIAEKV